jgi:hypothetical protein
MSDVLIIFLLIASSSSGWAGGPCKICDRWTPSGSKEVELSVAVLVATQPWTCCGDHVSKKIDTSNPLSINSCAYKYIQVQEDDGTLQRKKQRNHISRIIYVADRRDPHCNF